MHADSKHDTVWLSIEEMSSLFERDRTVISRHIKNVFTDKELNEKSNVHFLHIPLSDKPVAFYSIDVIISVGAKFARTRSDGKTYDVDHYNLDVIISVGYRVKSERGIFFRIWSS